MQPESFPPGFVAAPYADDSFNPNVLAFSDFLPQASRSPPPGDLRIAVPSPSLNPVSISYGSIRMRDTELLRYFLFPRAAWFSIFLLKKVRCLFEVPKPPSYLGPSLHRIYSGK